jgi:signal transduction histidine kinase
MRLKLAQKILLLVLAVLALGGISSAVAVYCSWRLQRLLQTTVAENLLSVRAAEELEMVLLDQRGLLARYILDQRNPSWVAKLKRVEPRLAYWLKEAKKTAVSDQEREILERLEVACRQYDATRDRVVALCEQNRVAEATTVLLDEGQRSYEAVYGECELLIKENERSVRAAVTAARGRVRSMTVIVGSLAAVTVVFGGGLLWVFFRGILRPLRQMVAEVRTFTEDQGSAVIPQPQDEMNEMGDYLRALMSDVADTRSTLQSNQSRLVQAEKLASVGKLAACVAHEIRNPLTAMKMWLFSLRKSVGTEPETDRKFALISEEVSRLEAVVQNFLEFTRPPHLNPQPLQMGELVEKTIELLGPTLAEKRVRVVVRPLQGLPVVAVDAEQIKQVLVNLIKNAAEAMPEGGDVDVSVGTRADASGAPLVVVRIRDHGGGITDDVRERLFEPFFTTKEGGTGLGLCVAARIVASHGGRLVLESSTDRGSCFALWIPQS